MPPNCTLFNLPVPIGSSPDSGLTNIIGAAISAVDEEVFIIYGETATSSLNLLKSTSSGEGTWDEYNIGTYTPGIAMSNIGIAADPTDTNYVYAVMVRGEGFTAHRRPAGV